MAANRAKGIAKKDSATVTIAEEETRTKLLWVSCRRFWFSANPLYQTLALGAVLFVYMAVGACVFVWLEKGTEEKRIADIQRATEELIQTLSVELPNATSERINNLVDSFFVACDAGLLANETEPLWDLGRAVMAAGSIVTTIGYVKTWSSSYATQWFIVTYALFGIPLIVAFLAVMGQLLSHIPRWILKPLQHRYWIHLVLLFLWLLVVFVALIAIPAAAIATIEGWSYREAFYFCFTSLSTIGLGDYSVGQKSDRLSNNSLTSFYKLSVVVWILLGLSHLSTIIAQVRDVWGGLWMRVKKFCRRVKKGLIHYAGSKFGKSKPLKKSAESENVSSAETRAEASAQQVERIKREKMQAECMMSPSKEHSETETASEKELQSLPMNHKQQKS